MSFGLGPGKQQKSEHDRHIRRKERKSVIAGDEGEGDEDDGFHEAAILPYATVIRRAKRVIRMCPPVRIKRL